MYKAIIVFKDKTSRTFEYTDIEIRDGIIHLSNKNENSIVISISNLKYIENGQ